MKSIEKLTAHDLRAFPVWQYVNQDGLGETAVRPVKTIPVKTLNNRVVGTEVKLANGTTRWALVGNIDLKNVRLTEHFLSLSLFDRGRWLPLARYHDADAKERGPNSLARSLELPVEAVFPINYDISRYCVGVRDVVVGSILSEPRERLTRAQVIALAVP